MFWKNAILYEIYSKKITVTEYFLHVSVHLYYYSKSNKKILFFGEK